MMKEQEKPGYSGLLKALVEYNCSEMYPFHMPGHKRAGQFPNPFTVDITEIEGFDNLHHAEGILKESMEWAASVYGAHKTYYLVNGSSCGILAAVSGVIGQDGESDRRILIARNCHKAAYHAVILNHLNVEYSYPQIIDEYGLQGGLMPSEIESMLIKHKDIRAVLVVSPTYDGVVSDIKVIAEIVHKAGIPLIVDEAHGAHFYFGQNLPESALELGADVVIQSLHKTLPSFTQTALLHVKSDLVDVGRLERYLQMYQTSSPSYIFVAGIEQCIQRMAGEGRQEMDDFCRWIQKIRKRLSKMKRLRLLEDNFNGHYGVHGLDISKIVVSCAGTPLCGMALSDILRQKYHLEMEMSGADYVTAITTVCDSQEGLERLEQALLEIDDGLERNPVLEQEQKLPLNMPVPIMGMPLWKAVDASWEEVFWQECAGRISGEFVYLYPPGIPLVAPGEMFTDDIIELLEKYKQMNLPVQGPADSRAEYIRVVKENIY